jgi:membrane protease YdiL (CAAX protease family)
MNDQTVFSPYKSTGNAYQLRPYRNLLEILVVFVPLAVCAYLGQNLGLKTMLSGLVINLGYILSVLTASVVLKLRGTGWKEIGLARPRSWVLTILIGVAAVVGAILVMNLVTVAIANLPGMEIPQPDITRFNPLEGNLFFLLGMIAIVWTTNTFGEELFYRAFLTTWLAEVFRNSNAAWALGAIGSSVAFGLAHYGEGVAGIFSNGAFGFLFALIYLRTGRNLWASIIAHGLLNTLRFVLIYLGAV